jgi:hypothetical protein
VIRVFLSVGRVATDQQREFVKEIEGFLQQHGLQPHTVGRNRFSVGPPLRTIMEEMNTSAGTAIVAFERKRVERGTELGGIGKKDVDLAEARYPTVWNQIEAAMAYVFGHPLLVIVEEGLRSEGLLERGHDWWVQWVEVAPGVTGGEEFLGVFSDWRARVEERAYRYLLDGTAPSSEEA